MIDRIKQLVLLLLCIALLLVPPYVFGRETVEGVLKWQNAKNWETTEGRILSSKAVRIGRRSRAHINYEFVVSDKRYRSWTIEPSETGNVKSVNDSGRLVGLHPPDSKVKVYFDANNPEDSLLYRDFSVGMWVNVISLLAFTGGAFGLVWGAWIDSRKKPF